MAKLFAFFGMFFILGNIGLYIYCLITPKIEISRNQSYYLYDNNESLIFNNYSWLKLDEISDYLIDATLSTEDKYFYKHMGFDYLRIAKAILNNITSRSLSEGASTITQQYARNLYLNYDKTWKRKLEEAILAFELETHYTKDEILEGYLNTINYGGVYGIENASRYYFNKSASELNLAEATMLAGIPQSPSNNSPLINIERAKDRQKIVLQLMVKNNIKSSDSKFFSIYFDYFRYNLDKETKNKISQIPFLIFGNEQNTKSSLPTHHLLSILTDKVTFKHFLARKYHSFASKVLLLLIILFNSKNVKTEYLNFLYYRFFMR